jgi:hypothetical protein
MRLLSKLALGGSVASVATAGCLVAAGVFATSATLVVTDPVARPAQADELTAFDSCAALLDWYVARGVKDVGAYGWDVPFYYGDVVMHSAVRTPAIAETATDSSDLAGKLDVRTSSGTGTNTQEAAVDEPDVAKTDGSLVARIEDDRTLVVVDVAHGAPTVLSRWRLPEGGLNSELLLVGDRVLVTQTKSASFKGGPYPRGDVHGRGYYGSDRAATRIFDLDISDPRTPHLLSTDTYSGSLVSLRQYGEVVRLVTTTPRPQLAWSYPHKGFSARESIAHNRALVRATTIEDWLPSVTRDGTRTSLTDCPDVYHPQKWSGADTVAVTTFGIDDPRKSTSVGLTADGQVVYSSADRLYVASVDYGPVVVHPAVDHGCPDCLGGSVRPVEEPAPVTTDLHAFALDGSSTTYAGSGHVVGTLRDRWSLDEHDGDLRVAWTRTGPRGSTRNGITVLGEQDGRLEPIGTVADLGPDEEIQSVRWFDDLAIVVTYRQVDPLYTVDLSDPADPRTLGALKVPGYSGYLHPLGDDLVLGLGVDGTESGTVTGSQAAVFDITDPTHPQRVSRAGLGPNAGIGALDDPRGFTWVPDERTAVTAVTDWNTDSARLVALRVSDAGQLTTRVLARLNQEWQTRTLPLPGGRLAVLDAHRVRVVELG